MEFTLFRSLFILFCFASSLFADLAHLYRTQGIDAVKERLEKELQTKEYWEEYLENKDTKFGYYESKQFILYCEKETKRLSLYENKGHSFEKISDDTVIVGEIAGDKQKEGDLKTPEGAYELTSKITKLDAFYGPLALVTNYPNTFDKALKKDGHGIWIHGMPLEEKREEYTKGCIALDNPKLTKLEGNINYDKSVLLISQDEVKEVSKEELSTILSFIYSWKEAWKDSNIEQYLSYYSEDFKKANGANFEDFKAHKTRIFKRKEDKTIIFSNIDIMPYPNSLNKRMFRVVMDEVYRTNSYNFEGEKELFIELSNNKVSILTEG